MRPRPTAPTPSRRRPWPASTSSRRPTSTRPSGGPRRSRPPGTGARSRSAPSSSSVADQHDTGAAARRALTLLLRESGRDVLATLTRTTGDLALAEDAVQDAVVRALETWPRDGVPPNPVAWLRLVARRRAVDLVRREAARIGKEDAAMDRSTEPDRAPADDPDP